jgi:hypothetical protein
LTTLDQRRALALRIAKTIGRDPASVVAALRSRLDTSFKFNPRQRRDDHGRWTDGGPSVPNMPSGPNFGGGGGSNPLADLANTRHGKRTDADTSRAIAKATQADWDNLTPKQQSQLLATVPLAETKKLAEFKRHQVDSKGEVKPRAGTFIGNVPETHKNARPQGDVTSKSFTKGEHAILSDVIGTYYEHNGGDGTHEDIFDSVDRKLRGGGPFTKDEMSYIKSAMNYAMENFDDREGQDPDEYSALARKIKNL